MDDVLDDVPQKVRVRIWGEDDATHHDPDHEGIEKAWKRLFGQDLELQSALRKEDHGDADVYYMPNGYEAVCSYPGASAIYKTECSGNAEREPGPPDSNVPQKVRVPDHPAVGEAWKRLKRFFERTRQGVSLLREYFPEWLQNHGVEVDLQDVLGEYARMRNDLCVALREDMEEADQLMDSIVNGLLIPSARGLDLEEPWASIPDTGDREPCLEDLLDEGGGMEEGDSGRALRVIDWAMARIGTFPLYRGSRGDALCESLLEIRAWITEQGFVTGEQASQILEGAVAIERLIARHLR